MENIYHNKINNYLSKLDTIDLSNPINVLEWFYEVRNANIMFGTYEVSNYVYNKIINCGYDDTITNTMEYQTYYTLIEKTNLDISVLAKNIISLILVNLRENKPIDLATISFISIFNEKYNSSNIYKLMMEELHNNIGNRITYNIIKDNNFELKVGNLDNVEDFNYIIVDNNKIPFIGNNIAISRIASSNGNIIYNNSVINTKDNLYDENIVLKLNKDIFKENYCEESTKVI